MKLQSLIGAIALAVSAGGVQAASSLNLANYQLTGNYALDTLGGIGLEASAVTYASDRNTLFFVGDEGLGVVEVSLTGQTLGSMAFNWAGTGSSNNDAEGLTYLGNGRLVVVDERPQVAYQFTYSAGGSVALNNQPKVAITGSTASVGNVGTEGISVDPRDGSFYSVKQDNPAQLRKSTLDFAVGYGTASTTTLFSGSGSLFGLNSLSDVQTLSAVDSLAGGAGADNLLILSLDSKMLVELTTAGQIVSSFDLSSVTQQAIEGVTVDTLGNIYLVAENNGSAYPNSRLFVLTPTAVPLPGALWLFGSALAGILAVRRKSA
ncbi:SdiA-regulated domain-containing protein [Methylomonas sp. UP202]|uniref:SdiA-regulated domain-containing protein n=1 Tax=Methylomonas sp. UP202 TaxID=3040943 RepID=UPI00143C0E1B|nr:SdiA-regulated domain-containing protein [Methylomonas sp. UP202]NJA08358.1 PEP-CTERM sorting domain-containing protein [Methylococcaceae bacterium WWC4]WGS86157.1 SdiA-regulated domain-containing protein [Methylomonas sp. UP202]